MVDPRVGWERLGTGSLLTALLLLAACVAGGVVALRRRALRLEAERWLLAQRVPSEPETANVRPVACPFYDQDEQWPADDEYDDDEPEFTASE